MQKYTCLTKFSRWVDRPFLEKNVHHNFEFSSKSGPPLFWNSRELWSPQLVKMQEYTCFPKSSSQNSDFPRKMSTTISSFRRNLGSPFSRIPGNFGRQKIAKNSRIYGFPWIRENQFKIFLGNFYEIPKSWIFLNFRKPPKFRGKGDLDKKDPKFSIFSGFFTKFRGAYRVYVAS